MPFPGCCDRRSTDSPARFWKPINRWPKSSGTGWDGSGHLHPSAWRIVVHRESEQPGGTTTLLDFGVLYPGFDIPLAIEERTGVWRREVRIPRCSLCTVC